MARAHGVIWLYVPFVLISACGRTDVQPETIGVPARTVVRTPVLSIGGEAEPEPLYQISGATRVNSGYLIANRSADEVRYYDEDGTLVERFGREGAGPREFRYPRIIGVLANDSTVVYDSSNDRVSVVCASGGICAEWPIRQRGQVVGVNRVHIVLQAVVNEPALETGVQRRALQVIAVSRMTGASDTLLATEAQPRQVGARDDNIFVMPLPFTRSPMVAVSSAAVIVANGRDPKLEVFPSNGEPPRQIELPIDLRPVTDDEFRAQAQAMFGEVSETEPGIAATIEAMDPPPFRPPVRRLLVDRTDLIWVELDQDEADVHDWLVVSLDGTVRAQATTPAAVDVIEIGDDYILGLARDSVDVEYVRQYSLQR